MVSVSASHVVGHGFSSQLGHTKDHHKNGTNCLPTWHGRQKGRSLTVQSDRLCGTVYGDMHLKDLLGSIVRVVYCIPVPDFYLVATKKHSINGLINQSYNHKEVLAD